MSYNGQSASTKLTKTKKRSRTVIAEVDPIPTPAPVVIIDKGNKKSMNRKVNAKNTVIEKLGAEVVEEMSTTWRNFQSKPGQVDYDTANEFIINLIDLKLSQIQIQSIINVGTPRIVRLKKKKNVVEGSEVINKTVTRKARRTIKRKPMIINDELLIDNATPYKTVEINAISNNIDDADDVDDVNNITSRNKIINLDDNPNVQPGPMLNALFNTTNSILTFFNRNDTPEVKTNK